MTRLQIHPLAEAELSEAARFYEARLPGLGLDFLEEIRRCFSRVHEFPNSGSPYFEGFRRLLLRRFPYCVVYELLPDGVLVVAVAHQRRKPGYWRRRP